MLFQPILDHENSLAVILDNMGDFTLHKHYENEILYCVRGSYKVIINNEPYVLREGNLAFIQSSVPHETIGIEERSLHLLIEAGPLFLGTSFDSVASFPVKTPVFNLNEGDFGNKIKPVIDEIIEEKEKISPNELIIRGNVARLFGLFLDEFFTEETQNDVLRINNMERVLELIHRSYSENVTVEKAAEIAGYGKSNFCKNFKKATGITFHQYLNRYRIERAKFFLKHSDMKVFEISEAVGFNDSKTFCRVFRELTGTTPKRFSDK